MYTTVDNLIYINTSGIKDLRQSILQSQNYICPITKETLNVDNSVLDHKHKMYKDQQLGINGIGCVRGVLHRQVNVLEGKINNSYYRLGLHKLDISLPDILRNLADYLEQNTTNYIHPTEVPRTPQFKKSCYNTLVKTLQSLGYTKKIPEYPKSKKLTKPLEKLFNSTNIIIEYY